MNGNFIEFDKLPDLTQQKRNEMDYNADLAHRTSGYRYKVIKHNNKKIWIETSQEPSKNQKLISSTTLKEKGESFFKQYFDAYEIHSETLTLRTSEINAIDLDWINAKLEQKNISVAQIVDETGIEESRITDWLDGTKPLNQTIKSLFFYYLKD